MKHILITWVLLLVLHAPSAWAERNLEGAWEGALDVNGTKLAIVVHVTVEGDQVVGKMDSPDQGAFGIPAEIQEWKQGVLKFKVPSAGASYEGRWDADSSSIKGTFVQGMELPLTLSQASGKPKGMTITGDLSPVKGPWFGAIELPGTSLDFVLEVTQQGDTFSAEAMSPQQSKQKIRVNAMGFQGGQLSFEINALGASYKGHLSTDQQTIQGQFSQNGQSFVLNFQRGAYPSEVNRPQTPQAPFDYSVEEVEVANKQAGHTLAGTLTLPKGDPKAALVLITGSGPQDRNETVFSHQPFWVIADHLTRHGYAVLRMDDRGVGASGGDFSSATTADFVTDISAGLDFLKQRADIPKGKLGLLGHSEGGMIAPMVGAARSDVAFLVLLAAPGVPIKDLMADQARDAMKAQGADAATAQKAWKDSVKRNAFLAKHSGQSDYVEQVKAYIEQDLKATGLSGEALDSAVQSQAASLTTAWFEYFIQFDPKVYLQQIHVPVLAINGETDVQVAAEPNLKGIKAALAGNKDVEIKAYPQLNHLFQTSSSGAVHEYIKIEETIAPQVLKDITRWLDQRF